MKDIIDYLIARTAQLALLICGWIYDDEPN